MKFTLQRLYHTTGIAEGDYSCGFLENDIKSFRSFTLEDTHRQVKIAGSTRIPSGFYELDLHRIDTPLTLKHRIDYKALPFFKANPKWFHIEIKNIQGFSGVYIHSGNDDKHTLGCVLPAYTFDISILNNQSGKSMLAVNDFYAIAYPLLESGAKVHLEISDEIK